MKQNKIILVIAIVLSIASIQSVYAQYGSFGLTEAQNISMGNTYNATSYGTMAIGKNPALMLYPSDSSSAIYLQFPNFAAQFGSNSLSIDDINKYFGGSVSRYLSDADKKDILDKFKDNAHFYADLSSKDIAITWKHSDKIGAIGFAVTDYLGGNYVIPSDLIYLGLNGNTLNKEFNFSDLDFKNWWIRMYSLSYARKIMDFDKESVIKNISVGASFKMVQGFAYIGMESINARFTTGENNIINGVVRSRILVASSTDLGIEYDFENNLKDNKGFMPEPAGSGIGFDLGFAADLDYGLRVGLSLTDIGSITWDKHTAELRTNKTITIDDLDSLDRVNFLNDTSFAAGSFSTSLPTALRLGVQYELTKTVTAIPGTLLLALDYNQGFNSMPSNSTSPRISFGAMWKTKPYIPVISTGLTNDMAGEIRWSVGLGFATKVLDIHFATLDLPSLISSSAKPSASFAMNLIWRIGY
jgi:hypothetical protein